MPSAEYVARRDDIVATAARVFQQRGYDAGSLDDVAAELDLRKASLYYYVRSKGELLSLVFDQAITRALERLHGLAEVPDPRERLAALIRHQVVTVAGDPTLFSVFFDQRVRLAETYRSEIHRKEREYLRAYVQAVQAAIEAGVLPEGDARDTAQAIFGMATWVYKWFDPERDDVERFAETCVGLVLGEFPRPTG